MDWHFYNPTFEYEKKFFDTEWPWAGHKYFAYDLVINVKPHIIVELGTHKGTSFFSMCQAVKDGHINSKLYAIDTWKGDEHAGYYTDTVFNEVKNIQNEFYPLLKINLIRKYFDEAKSDFEDKSIDLLHIDGLHTYEAVKHDFDNWLKKVKPGGIILFHDISEKKDDFGVYILWEELKKKYKTLEFYHSHGLGVIFTTKSNIKLDTITALRSYYELSQLYKQTEYKLFHCKNESNLYKEKLDELNKQKNEITEENSGLEKEIEITNKEINNYIKLINQITNSKFYKIWLFFCNCKKILNKWKIKN